MKSDSKFRTKKGKMMAEEDLAAISARMKAKQGKQASVWRTSNFITVRTMSGRAMLSFDPDGIQTFFEPSISDDTLGLTTLEALQRSRFFGPTGGPNSWSGYFGSANKLNEEWMTETLRRYGYRSERDMFKAMEICNIKLADGVITLSPYRPVRGQSAEPDEEYLIRLPAESAPAEIGAALRRAWDSVAKLGKK